MVFKTNNDHIAFHGGAEAVLDIDGVYYCIKKDHSYIYCYNDRTAEDIKNNVKDIGSVHVMKDPKMSICPYCETNLKHFSSEMCNDCRKKKRQENAPTKEILEELIYKESFVTIGKMFDVSDNAVRKWCKRYGLPYRKSDIKQMKNINT